MNFGLLVEDNKRNKKKKFGKKKEKAENKRKSFTAAE